MRIISLDLLLGTPRLQRRIEGERMLLERDLQVARGNTDLLREGAARQATSLPALAAALATGFVVTKFARRPRRPARRDPDRDAADEREGNATLTAATSLAWQFVMPLLLNWVQAKFAPKEEVPVAVPEPAAPENFTTEP